MKPEKLLSFIAGMLKDYTGKPSITAYIGAALCSTAGVGFLYSLWTKNNDGMMYAFGFATLGAGLLGYRKGVNGKPDAIGIEIPKPGQPIE